MISLNTSLRTSVRILMFFLHILDKNKHQLYKTDRRHNIYTESSLGQDDTPIAK